MYDMDGEISTYAREKKDRQYYVQSTWYLVEKY
jgi:hypothetical protein